MNTATSRVWAGRVWAGPATIVALTVMTAGLTVAAAAQHDARQGRVHHQAGARSAMSVMPFLRQLELTDAQRQSVQSVVEGSQAQRDALRKRQREHAAALQGALPDSQDYLSLVETSKQLAAEAIQQRSELQTQVYKVLTPEQKARLPQLIEERKATIEQRRQQRMERRARRGTTPQA